MFPLMEVDVDEVRRALLTHAREPAHCRQRVCFDGDGHASVQEDGEHASE